MEQTPLQTLANDLRDPKNKIEGIGALWHCKPDDIPDQNFRQYVQSFRGRLECLVLPLEDRSGYFLAIAVGSFVEVRLLCPCRDGLGFVCQEFSALGSRPSAVDLRSHVERELQKLLCAA